MRVSYEEGQEIAKTHTCGETGCQKHLILRWWQDGYDVCCPVHKDSTNFERYLSYTKARQQGLPIDPYVEQAIKHKEEMKRMENWQVTHKTTGETQRSRAATPEQAAMIVGWDPEKCNIERADESTTSPLPALTQTKDVASNQELSPQAQQYLVDWAEELHLRADLGHVVAYYGKPYCTVDGLVYNARRQDPDLSFHLAYLDIEQRRAIGLDNGDYAVTCKVHNGYGKQLSERIGIVTREEQLQTAEGKPGQSRYPVLSKKPLEMAENRAMWDAFMDAYPLGLDRQANLQEMKEDNNGTTR